MEEVVDLSKVEYVKFERINRGRRNSSVQVLDVGAGFSVDSRATHAIDKGNSPKGGGSDLPNKRVISNVNYYPRDVDIVKEGLPYSNSKFDKVVSYGAFGWNFGNIKSAKELRRVLKVDGNIELGVNKENLKYTVNILKRAGFKDINVESTPDRPDVFKIDAVK